MQKGADWCSQPLGKTLLALEKQCIKRWLSEQQGDYLLVLSQALQLDDIKTHRIRHSFLAENTISKQHQLMLNVSELPFANESFDSLVLHHHLEFLTQPAYHQALCEAERVLTDHGQLLIIGFNPYSFLGLWRLWRSLSQKKTAHPWPFHSLTQLKRTLADTTLIIEAVDYFFYRPAWCDANTLKTWGFLESVGQKLWPSMGGIYAVRIRKKTLGFIDAQAEPCHGMRESYACTVGATRVVARRSALPD